MKYIKSRLFFIVSLVILSSICILFINKFNKNKNIVDMNNLYVMIYGVDNCRYCRLAKDELDSKGISYKYIEISDDQKLRKDLVDKTNQFTVPYIFIGDGFIGGYRELKKILDNKY